MKQQKSKPVLRTVKKVKGEGDDIQSKEIRQTGDYNPWNSIYKRDFKKELARSASTSYIPSSSQGSQPQIPSSHIFQQPAAAFDSLDLQVQQAAKSSTTLPQLLDKKASRFTQQPDLSDKIDDSEFYRQVYDHRTAEQPIVVRNIADVLKCKTCLADKMYEKTPFFKESVYGKDYKPQDMSIARTALGESNNPFLAFRVQPIAVPINTIHRVGPPHPARLRPQERLQGPARN